MAALDDQRYHLLAWGVMPNHVHVMIEQHQGYPLARVIESWKSYTAKAINRSLGRSGRVWQSDYRDRCIRDEQHFDRAIAYIHENPVKARLVERAEDWEWSSAARAVRRPGRPLPQEGTSAADAPQRPPTPPERR